MSFLWMDGCDYVAAVADIAARYTALATLNSTNYGITTNGGAFGGGAIQLKGVSSAVTHGVRGKILAGGATTFAATATLLAGGWMKAVVVGAFTATHEEAWMKLRVNGGECTTITYNPFNNEIKLYAGDGPGGTQLGTTATFDLKDGNWHWIEWKLVANNAGAGSSTLKIDNTEITQLTVTATSTSSNASLPTAFDIYPNFRTAGESIDLYIDDLFVVDTASGAVNDFMGKRRIYTLHPDGDSSVTFTPSSGGTNYNLVDETTLDETDYVSSATAGNVDLYTGGAYGGPATINAVQVATLCKLASGTSNSQQSRLSSNGNLLTSTAVNITAAIFGTFVLADLDPNGSIAWTVSAVDATLWGPRCNGLLGAGTARVYMVYMEVMTSSVTAYTFDAATGAFALAGGTTARNIGLATATGAYIIAFGVSGRRHQEARPEAREQEPRDHAKLHKARAEDATLAKVRNSRPKLLKFRGRKASLSITGKVSSDD